MTADSRLRICLVDLSGEAKVAYTPLGIMLLKAALDMDERLETSIHPFLAGTTLTVMIEEIYAVAPDLIGLSCQGWNITVYRQMLPTLRQLLPGAVIVLGGNHVSHQGGRWLAQLPEIDVVVTGEGEETICELARSVLEGEPRFAEIAGLAFRESDTIIETAERPRMTALRRTPSPYLMPGVDLGRFDVALWETNRGCPYHCSFCHWGDAVGQKITKVDFNRLEEELDSIGRAGIETIFLCDANFGILHRDVEIAHMVVRTLKRHGAPRALHVNWAKDHAGKVQEILTVLGAGGVHTNVYLALQTMSRPALELAGRSERGRAEMLEVAGRVLVEGGEVGAELIFGLPGETLEEFRAAYDELFLVFPSLLIHPLWILPNTTYDRDRSKLGLVTIRPDPAVDYEGVLRHATLSVEDNRAGLRLLLSDEVLVSSGYARTTLRGLARWAGLRPASVLEDFPRFLAGQHGRLGQRLRRAFEEIGAECYFHRRFRSEVRGAIYADAIEARDLLVTFVDSLVTDPGLRRACWELAVYDTALLPRPDLAEGTGALTADSFVDVSYDTHAAARSLLEGVDRREPLEQQPVRIHLRHPVGFARHLEDPIDLSAQWRGHVIDVTSRLESSRNVSLS